MKEHQDAFKILKQKLMIPSLLELLDEDLETFIFIVIICKENKCIEQLHTLQYLRKWSS